MVWMSVISLALFAWLCYYLLKKNRNDPYANAGLILKLLAGVVLGIIYKYHYKGGDTFSYFQEATTIANFLFDHPIQFFQLYFHTAQLPDLTNQIAFGNQPRALLFSKIVSVFYIFTGGNYWIISAFLSLINFMCIHFLVKELSKRFEGLKKAASFSFYFLPTFVFWTSGLLKESLAIGALAIAVGVVVRFSRIQLYSNYTLWLYLISSSALLWKLKYFYAAIAIPLLLGLLLYSVINKWKKAHPMLLFFFIIVGLLFVTTLRPNLAFDRVFEVIYENYQWGVSDSDSLVIHYYNFDGGWYGFLLNLPLAFFSGLFRPTVFDVSNPLQFVVALENLVVFILLIVSLWKARFRFSIKNPFVIATIIYVSLLSVFLAFATPNLGTLSRYKVGYWPFFAFLVLTLYFLTQKKGQAYNKPDQ